MFVIVTKYKWYKWNRNTNKKLWKLKIIKYMKANKPFWNKVSIDFINVWEYEEFFLVRKRLTTGMWKNNMCKEVIRFCKKKSEEIRKNIVVKCGHG